jgi:16S rRNA G966 N2-methylase RsmD
MSLEYLFPPYQNDTYQKLLIDDESYHYITPYLTANVFSDLLVKHWEEFNNGQNVTIVDGTGGVGGDTIAFSKNFHNVVSIEKDYERYEILKNNIKVYDLNNVEVLNSDVIDYSLNPDNYYDIIHFDPPWGGSDYKKYTNLKLQLGDLSIEEFIVKINNKGNPPKLISIKLPKNYDLNFLCSYLFENNIKHISVNIFKKMYLVIINLSNN